MIALRRRDDFQPRRRVDVEHGAALARRRDQIVLRDDESAPVVADEQQRSPRRVGRHTNDAGVLVDIGEQPDRLAMAASTGQFGGVERINLAIGGEGPDLRGRLREKRRLQRVVALIGQGRHIGDMALERANPALLRNHDGDRLALDHRFRQIEVPGLRRVLESRASRPELCLQAERLLQLADLRGDGAPLLGLVGEQPLDLGAFLGQLRMFLAQLHFLELAQGAKARVENIVGLHVRELEGGLERGLGVVLLSDDADHLVEIEKDDEHPFELFEPAQDRREPMARAAQQHLAAMIEPLPQRLVQRDDARRDAVDQHIHIDGKARLQFGELEQRLHHQRRIDIFRARFENNADILGGFVAHIRDQRQLLLHHQLGEPLDQPRFLHAIGYFRDDGEPAAARLLFLVPAGAQPERTAPGAIGFDNVGALVDDNAARRKIRPLHEGEQLLGGRGAVADQIERGVAKLGDIMRRHRGRHADRYALRAIGEEIWQRRRQHDRLFLLARIIGLEVDRVVVDPLQKQPRDGGHARFGVAVGGGRIAVDIAEIALAVDQRVARREILGEAHQRVVDCLVAVRMERAHHVADDLRAFLEWRSRVEPQNVHSIENAAMHGL